MAGSKSDFPIPTTGHFDSLHNTYWEKFRAEREAELIVSTFSPWTFTTATTHPYSSFI